MCPNRRQREHGSSRSQRTFAERQVAHGRGSSSDALMASILTLGSSAFHSAAFLVLAAAGRDASAVNLSAKAAAAAADFLIAPSRDSAAAVARSGGSLIPQGSDRMLAAAGTAAASSGAEAGAELRETTRYVAIWTCPLTTIGTEPPHHRPFV